MFQDFLCFEYIHMVLDAECLGVLLGRNTVEAMEAVKRGEDLALLAATGPVREVLKILISRYWNFPAEENAVVLVK
jgi:hypothetical protein